MYQNKDTNFEGTEPTRSNVQQFDQSGHAQSSTGGVDPRQQLESELAKYGQQAPGMAVAGALPQYAGSGGFTAPTHTQGGQQAKRSMDVQEGSKLARSSRGTGVQRTRSTTDPSGQQQVERQSIPSQTHQAQQQPVTRQPTQQQPIQQQAPTQQQSPIQQPVQQQGPTQRQAPIQQQPAQKQVPTQRQAPIQQPVQQRVPSQQPAQQQAPVEQRPGKQQAPTQQQAPVEQRPGKQQAPTQQQAPIQQRGQQQAPIAQELPKGSQPQQQVAGGRGAQQGAAGSERTAALSQLGSAPPVTGAMGAGFQSGGSQLQSPGAAATAPASGQRQSGGLSLGDPVQLQSGDVTTVGALLSQATVDPSWGARGQSATQGMGGGAEYGVQPPRTGTAHQGAFQGAY